MTRARILMATAAIWIVGSNAVAQAAENKTCPKTSTAVTYCDEARKRGEVLNLFYDREGNLYPSADVAVDTRRMTSGFANPRTDAVNVRGYFQREAQHDGSVVPRLAADAGISVGEAMPSKLDSAMWQRIQAGYRAQFARRLLAKSDGAPVVFIIQGYRNDYDDAREWYTKLDEMVLARKPSATMVHVYWDGLTGVRFLNLWKKAQYNMTDVGLEFRRLLNELPEETPIRIITHSTGAPLLANALGDASQAFRDRNGKPLEKAHGPYYERAAGLDGNALDAGSYVIKKKAHLRWGAVAPAATSITFDRYKSGRDVYPERIVMALNRRDSATGKMPFSCSFYGSSCMTVRPVESCTLLHAVFDPAGTNVAVFDFALSQNRPSPGFLLWQQHSLVGGYSVNERWEPFLSRLLDDSPVVPDDSAVLCGTKHS